MRAQFNTVDGQKICITHVKTMDDTDYNKIEFRSNGWLDMELYINDELFCLTHILSEFTSKIDSQIVLSADKEE